MDKVEKLEKVIEKLIRKMSRMKNQLAMKDAVLHEKNKFLDYLHYVWCDGGCHNGIHRYHKEELTEEMVLYLERQAKRLRTYYENKKYRSSSEKKVR